MVSSWWAYGGWGNTEKRQAEGSDGQGEQDNERRWGQCCQGRKRASQASLLMVEVLLCSSVESSDSHVNGELHKLWGSGKVRTLQK